MKLKFVNVYGYQANITDENGNVIPNPQSETDFAESKIKGYIKEVVAVYEIQETERIARESVDTSMNVN